MSEDAQGWALPKVTAVLVLADGTVLEGEGFGRHWRGCRRGCVSTRR